MTAVLYDAPGPKTRRRSRIISAIVLLAVAAILAWVILTLAAQGVFAPERWDIFNDPLVWRALLEGLWVTLQVAFYGAILAISLGMVLSLLRSSDRAGVRIPTTIVLEFLRGMPVLLMILFILLLFSTGAFWAVVIALGLYNGAIIGEALRSGLASLPRGQRESGLAIGLGSLQTRLLIEFPQAFRTMLPIIVAQMVVLLKDTALGYIVGNIDLIRRGRLLAEFFGAGQYALSVFFVMVAMYLTVNLTISAIARLLARQRGQKLDMTKVTDAGSGSL
jgi:glutamate transport system permease protein